MEKGGYLACLRADAAALATAARLGLTASVPSCPGWSVADLVVHTGAVHRSQAALVAARAQEPIPFDPAIFASVPGLPQWVQRSALLDGPSDLQTIPDGLVEWFEEGAAILEKALREADPDEPVWSWSDNNRVAHYLRMMPIETAVHRWDAQLAHGRTEPVDTPLAVDGVDQTFEVMLPMRRARRGAPAGSGESYSFVQTDGPGVWLVRFAPERVHVDHGPGEASVTVRAPASDLFLYLWGRLPAQDLDVRGDASMLDRYFELVPPI